MAQNRKKLVELFIGNLVTSVVHKILRDAVGKDELSEKYFKELTTSYEIAAAYRSKINPKSESLKDANQIRTKVSQRVRAEMQLRISKGYKNINLGLVDKTVEQMLEELKVM